MVVCFRGPTSRIPLKSTLVPFILTTVCALVPVTSHLRKEPAVEKGITESVITKLLITPVGGGVVGVGGIGMGSGVGSFEQEVHITTTISTNVLIILKNV